MIIYIPQNIDPYNTHLKNLVEAYILKGVEIIVGFENFISGEVMPDAIHFHFPQSVLKYVGYNERLFFDRMQFFKQSGTKFLFTMHDLPPSDKSNNTDFPQIYKKFLNYIDLFVHHGKSSISILLKQNPSLISKCHIICHHGDYLNDMGHFNKSQDSARMLLKLPLKKKIILIFGRLHTKNTFFAEEVFNRIRINHADAILLMAGVFPLFHYNKLNLLYYRLNNKCLNKFRNNKIQILKRFSQFETYLLFVSSNVIFLPHKSGLTSGIIPLSATLGKPFVYPNIGVFEEQANDCYAVQYECCNIKSAHLALENLLTSGIQSFNNERWLKNNNWGNHVENILANLYL